MDKESEPIRVLLWDSRSNLMRGIEDQLGGKKRFTVSSVSKDVSLRDVIEDHKPDVIICDIDREGLCDSARLEEIARLSDGRARVIALSDHEDRGSVGACFSRGVWGYELKSCREDEIPLAIQRVHSGMHFLCSSLAGEWIRSDILASPPFSPNLLNSLTHMEKKVLEIIKQNGGNAKEIAIALDISMETSRKHIHYIMQKLQIHSFVDLRFRLLYSKI
jgi:DNA-binding NarL/FixJ family response regulator